MSGDMKVCDIDQKLKSLLHEFRFSKNSTDTCAVIMKVDRDTHTIILEQELDNITIEDLVEELPDHQPRYIVLSYRMVHDKTGEDDQPSRISYPLCFIFLTPRDCNPELQMMYAGSKLSLQKELNITRVYELRELEELTEEWLRGKIK